MINNGNNNNKYLNDINYRKISQKLKVPNSKT